jgi:hypothetical protein
MNKLKQGMMYAIQGGKNDIENKKGGKKKKPKM